MKSDREFEFIVGADEKVPVEITSLATWVANNHGFTVSGGGQTGYDSPARGNPQNEAAAKRRTELFRAVSAMLQSRALLTHQAYEDHRQRQIDDEELELRIQSQIDKRNFLVAGTKLGNVITTLRSTNFLTAIAAQAALAGVNITDIVSNSEYSEALADGAFFSGLAIGMYLANQGPHRAPSQPTLTQSEIETFVDARVSGHTKVLEVTARQIQSDLEDTTKELAEKNATYSDLKTTLERLLAEAPKELNTLRETFRFEGSTRAAFEHWDGKSGEHESKSQKWLYGLAVAFAIYAVVLYCLFSNVPISAKWYEVPFSVSILFAVSSVVAVWVGRLIAKQYLSERHLMQDASERSALIKTFASMIKGEQISSEQIGVVLSTIFRSASTGLLSGDASPTLPSDAVAKLVEKVKLPL